MYTVSQISSYLTNKTYHRLACQKTVNFFVATNSKLVVHERGSRHVEGLARLRKEKQDAEERAIPLQDLSDGQLPQQPGASEAKQQVVMVEAESADGCPCHGLGLEEGSPLHSLRAGITTFFQRMPLSEARPDPLEHLLECLRVSMCRGGFSSHVCEALLVAEQAACCQSSDQRILSQLTRCNLGGEDQIRGLNFPSSRLVGEGSYEGGAFEH